MKLRIKGNSLRLRLTQGEIAQLLATGKVEDSIRFGPGKAIAYALAWTRMGDHIKVDFDHSRITVHVPEAAGRRWATSAQVGLEADQPVGNGESLRLLIEKDFACLQPRAGEDDTDAFPHPTTDKTC